MNILIMKLCFVFVVIIAILWMKRPLFWAISGGLAAARHTPGYCRFYLDPLRHFTDMTKEQAPEDTF